MDGPRHGPPSIRVGSREIERHSPSIRLGRRKIERHSAVYDRGVPVLTAPTTALRSSFLEALAEYHAEGRNLDLDSGALSGRRAFRDYVRRLRGRAHAAEVAEGRVAETVLWWADGGVYLGRLSIRHALTESLRRRGGHIGYDVRPSARRRGHGTQMLAAALPIAKSLGVDPALVTCDARNVPSRRIIESAGGALQDELAGELRFWVPTAAQSSAL